MKKIFVLFFLAMISLNSAFAKTENFQNEKSMRPVSCAAITNNGRGSYFESSDQSMDAKLYYNGSNGNGISGGFGAIVDGEHLSAALTDSQCTNSIVSIKWSTRTFAGHLVGNLTSIGLVNVSGVINNNPVSGQVLLYKGHA